MDKLFDFNVMKKQHTAPRQMRSDQFWENCDRNWTQACEDAWQDWLWGDWDDWWVAMRKQNPAMLARYAKHAPRTMEMSCKSEEWWNDCWWNKWTTECQKEWEKIAPNYDFMKKQNTAPRQMRSDQFWENCERNWTQACEEAW